MGKLEVGKKYTSINGNEWLCIAISDSIAHMRYYHNAESTAYAFNVNGENISQGGGDYNIKFEPVVETVNVVGSINERCNSGKFITFHERQGDHKFNMTVDFIDGKPDWSTSKVTGA